MKTKLNMPKVRKKEGNKQAFRNQDSINLKYAFISGILIAVLLVFSIILNLLFAENTGVLQAASIIQNVLTIILTFYLFFGFVILGKKYSNLLKITSILIIILIVVFYLLMLFSATFFDKSLMPKLDEKVKSIGFGSATEFLDYISTNSTESQKYTDFMMQEVIPLILPLLILFLCYFLISFVLCILFGVGLIKIGNNVKYGKIAGILTIVGVCTMIIFIGIFVWLAAYVFMLIILFNESRKKII